MPMAGLGLRFKFAGFKDPKPLILIDGKPVIEHIINLFSPEDTFLFICNENHLRDTNLQEVITRVRPDAKIVGIKEHYLGPVYTTLQAVEHIIDDQPAMVCYCDINVYWNINEFKTHVAERDADSAVIAFKGFHPPLLQEGFYATARVNDQLDVLEVREKHSFTPDKMDSWTSAGMHYFKRGDYIKKYFARMIERQMLVNKEYYVSMSHNLLIEDGLKNILYPIDHFISWGKPDDVREYQYWSKHFNKENGGNHITE